MKLGVDIVQIKRLARLLENKAALAKVFHDHEITDNIQTLAGRFAAKEAYFKAMGNKGDWLDLEISNAESGQPFILVKGQLNKNVLLSISHETDYAVAVVIITHG